MTMQITRRGLLKLLGGAVATVAAPAIAFGKQAAAAVIDKWQFIFSTGNIDSGTITIHGLSKHYDEYRLEISAVEPADDGISINFRSGE